MTQKLLIEYNCTILFIRFARHENLNLVLTMEKELSPGKSTENLSVQVWEMSRTDYKDYWSPADMKCCQSKAMLQLGWMQVVWTANELIQSANVLVYSVLLLYCISFYYHSSNDLVVLRANIWMIWGDSRANVSIATHLSCNSYSIFSYSWFFEDHK